MAQHIELWQLIHSIIIKSAVRLKIQQQVYLINVDLNSETHKSDSVIY